MQVRRHLPRLIPRSVEMFLLLMPRSFEVFSPACGCPFLPFHKLEHIYYPDQLKFFPPARGVVHSFFFSRWNLLLIKSANFRVHFGIQSPSTSTVRNFRFSFARFKKFE